MPYPSSLYTDKKYASRAVWYMMLQRCENPKNVNYHLYGALGIRVCEEWHDYEVFADWILANLGPWSPGMSLDRWPDNKGDYKPGNVRWADPQMQADNRDHDGFYGNSRPVQERPQITPNDRLLTPGEVAKLFRVDPKTVTRWAASGRITSIKTPGNHRRFREVEIMSLLRGDQPGGT